MTMKTDKETMDRMIRRIQRDIDKMKGKPYTNYDAFESVYGVDII